jgi:UDP-N-acetylmuramoyl-tripeptide--D-alanyl-D-alanine ligase
MAEAIALCDELDWSGRRVYIIGSMLELGDESAAAHAVLGRTLAASRADLIILYGEETKSALASLKEAEQRGLFNGKVYGITDRDGLFNLTADLIRDGDLVLLKGSRGCALEQLTGILTAETAAAKGVV